jgi:hypothetical protein
VTSRLILGMDPSLRGFGIADADRTDVFTTKAGRSIDDRVDDLLDAIDEFVFLGRIEVPVRQLWIVEAPMLASGPDSGRAGSHLYEIGALMRGLRSEYASEVRSIGVELEYLEVGIGALRHHCVGVGTAAKKDLPYMVERIHGRTFARIPKITGSEYDRLVAWSAYEYGRDYNAGAIVHRPAALRGSGEREHAKQRKLRRQRQREQLIA